MTTDKSPTLAKTIRQVVPTARHDTTQYADNRVESDHGRLKASLRPMRGLQRDWTASVIIRGHAFMQNLRRGHYELGIDVSVPETPVVVVDLRERQPTVNGCAACCIASSSD